MRNFRLLRSMPVLQTLQDWQIMQLHSSPPKFQTWSHFQFLRKPRNSSVQASQKLSSNHSNNTLNQHQTNFSKSSTTNYSSEISKNQVFYSTCSKPPKKPDCPPKKSDCPPKKSECPPKKSECPPKKAECPPKKKECAPPKKTDCAPKPKKCPEKSSCDSDYYEKKCPDYRDTASCSTNKPKCPEKKCQDPPKPKPKAKACNPPEEKSVCSKPPSKPSGCGGGKNPPPCGSRSFSSYRTPQTLAMTSEKSFGDEQCEKIQEICGKNKGKCDDPKAIADVNTGKDENFDDRMKREKEEMLECLKEKTDFTGIDLVHIYYDDFIKDIISRDVKRLFKESDLHEELFDKNPEEVHDRGIVSKNENNWNFPQFIN